MWNWRMLPRRYWIVAGILAVSLALSSAGLWCGAAAQRESRELSRQLGAAERSLSAKLERLAAETTPVSAREYLLRTCEGKIGVYNATGTVLYEIMDVDIRTLPAADRAMLDEGIIVTGEAALRSLTEDYSS